MDGSPELLFFVQTLLARCLMEPWCPHWGPQHFEAFGVPHFGAQLFHPLWDFCCRFQVRVLPMCNRIPALWNNLSANKSYILRHLSVWTVLTHRPRRRTTPRKEFTRALCTAKLKRISSAGHLVRLLLPDLAMPPLIVHPMVPSTLNARKATGVAMIPLPTISPRKHCGTRGPKPLSCRLTKLSIEGPKSVMARTAHDGASVRATKRRNDVPVAIPLTPPSVLDTAVMVAIVKSRATSGLAEPREILCHQQEQLEHLAIVEAHSQHLVTATTRTWCRSGTRSTQTFGEYPRVELERTFWDELQHFFGYVSHLLLWSSPLKFLESCVVLRGQSCSHQRLSSSRHLALLDQRLCHPAPVVVLRRSTASTCLERMPRPSLRARRVRETRLLLVGARASWKQSEQFPSSRFSNNVALVFRS